jgi:hypothetical protein
MHAITAFVFELGVALVFLTKKGNSVKMRKRAINLDADVIDQIKDAERQQHFLFISGVLMLCYVSSVLIAGFGALSFSPEVIVGSLLFGTVIRTGIGFCHIMSLPYRITEIQFKNYGIHQKRSNSIPVVEPMNPKDSTLREEKVMTYIYK